MKRRAFLALAGGLALAPVPALAGKKKGGGAAKSAKSSAKAGGAAKASGKGSKSSAKGSRSSKRHGSVEKADRSERIATARAAAHRAPPTGLRPLSNGGFGAPAPAPVRKDNEPWRHYELTLKVTPPAQSDALRLWMPMPMETRWQRLESLEWLGNFSHGGILRDNDSGLLTFLGDWKPGTANPSLTLTMKVGTRQRLFDITRRAPTPETEDTLSPFLDPYGPWSDEVISELADTIIGRIREPMPQALAVFNWVTEHAGAAGSSCKGGEVPESVAPALCSVREEDDGHGVAGLFVALCRATGIPARIVVGQRLGLSRQSPALGRSGDVSRAFHVRAEFYAPYYGWVPVDPADAARVAVLDRSNGEGAALRRRLFGFWEMNWIAYSNADSVHLPQGPDQSYLLNSPVLAASVSGNQVRMLARPTSLSLEARPTDA